MNSAREAAAVLERLPSLAAFGLPSPSAILLQNAAKVPAQPIATRPQASTLYEVATPAPSTSTAYPQLRRGRPRLDRSTLRCAHCGSTESTQWRTSSLYEFFRLGRLSTFLVRCPRSLLSGPRHSRQNVIHHVFLRSLSPQWSSHSLQRVWPSRFPPKATRDARHPAARQEAQERRHDDYKPRKLSAATNSSSSGSGGQRGEDVRLFPDELSSRLRTTPQCVSETGGVPFFVIV